MKQKTNLITIIVLGLLFIPIIALGAYFIHPHASSQKEKEDVDLTVFLKEKGYAAIQLKQLRSGILYFTAEVNDSTAYFFLDTGAGYTIMDQAVVAKFGLEVQESDMKAKGSSGDGIMHLKESSIKKFKMNDFILNDYDIFLMSFEHIHTSFEVTYEEDDEEKPRFEGMVGADLLGLGKAIIDYENLVLYLMKPQ